MDDRFLKDAWRAPRREFADGLRAKLAREDEGAAPAAAGAARPARRLRWLRALVPAAAALFVVALFTVPGMRAGASAFLDLFRVRTFTAIAVDPERLARLDRATVDLNSILGGQVTERTEPGPPRFFTDLAQAGAAAGIQPLVPAYLPTGWAADTIAVRGEGRAEIVVDTHKLVAALKRLELDDVTVPPGLDGAHVSVHLPPALIQQFTGNGHQVMLLEAESPEVGLPPGVDLPRLGEIGLRIVGMDAAEAHRFAQTIDWHGTVLVPVPTDASSFRQVSVRGHDALLVTRAGVAVGAAQHGAERMRPRDARRNGRGVVLLWSEGGRVYGLEGAMDPENVLQVANSLR
jgi:hypothetical protein